MLLAFLTKMVKRFFLVRTGCFSSNNSSLVERTEIKTKIRKKTFGDLETNILCYAKCSFIVTCTKQRWKCKAPWRHVLITFEDAIKIWFEKKCFMSLFWDISKCSLLKYNVSSVWFWHCMSDLFWTDFNIIRLSVVDLQWNKST